MADSDNTQEKKIVLDVEIPPALAKRGIKTVTLVNEPDFSAPNSPIAKLFVRHFRDQIITKLLGLPLIEKHPMQAKKRPVQKNTKSKLTKKKPG